MKTSRLPARRIGNLAKSGKLTFWYYVRVYWVNGVTLAPGALESGLARARLTLLVIIQVAAFRQVAYTAP